MLRQNGPIGSFCHISRKATAAALLLLQLAHLPIRPGLDLAQLQVTQHLRKQTQVIC